MAEAKGNHDTQFYRIKGGGAVPRLPPPSPMTFERVDKIYESQRDRAGFIKIFEFHPLYQSYWREEGDTPPPPFIL